MRVQRHNKLTSIEDSDHLVDINLFTHDFFLSRLSLSTVASCSESTFPCTLPPTHKPAVLLIDSLRIDFLSPHPPQPHSP
jgi:phosphatidylinositol glycan class O